MGWRSKLRKHLFLAGTKANSGGGFLRPTSNPENDRVSCSVLCTFMANTAWPQLSGLAHGKQLSILDGVYLLPESLMNFTPEIVAKLLIVDKCIKKLEFVKWNVQKLQREDLKQRKRTLHVKDWKIASNGFIGLRLPSDLHGCLIFSIIMTHLIRCAI